MGDAERQKRLLRGAVQGGKVRPKHQTRRKRGKPFNEERKIGYQLRRASGDIDDPEREPPGEGDDRTHRLPGHDLFPARTGLEVAMPATEIAQVPRVHLESGDLSADEGEPMAIESLAERLDPGRLPDAGPDPRRYFRDFRHDVFRQSDSVPCLHGKLFGDLPHLHPVDQGRAAADRRRHVDRLGHLGRGSTRSREQARV